MEFFNTLKALQYDEITGDIVVIDGKNCSCIGLSLVINDPDLVQTIKFARNVDVATAQVYVQGDEPRLIIPENIEYTDSSAIFTFSRKIVGDVRFTIIYSCDVEIGGLPDPTPTPTPQPTTSVTPSNTQTPTPTGTQTPTPSVSKSQPLPSPTIDTSQSPTPTAEATVTPTPSPFIVVSLTPTPTGTPSITPSPTPTIGVTPSVTPTISPTPSITPTITPTASPLPSEWVGIYSNHDFEGDDLFDILNNDVVEFRSSASNLSDDFGAQSTDRFGLDWVYTESGGPGGSRVITQGSQVLDLETHAGMFGFSPNSTFFPPDPLDSVFNQSGEMTFMFFANIPAQTGATGLDGSRICAISDNTNYTFGSGRTNGLYYDYVDGQDSLFWYNRNSVAGLATEITNDFTNSPYNGVWVHFAQTITWGSGLGDTPNHERIIYINGQVFDTTTGANTRPDFETTELRLRLGGSSTNATFADSSIAYVRTFNRILDQTEIQYHYNNGNGRPYLG